METPANGRRAVNRIVVTDTTGEKITVMVDKISHYTRLNESAQTFLYLGRMPLNVKETVEEIDKLIDEALGE